MTSKREERMYYEKMLNATKHREQFYVHNAFITLMNIKYVVLICWFQNSQKCSEVRTNHICSHSLFQMINVFLLLCQFIFKNKVWSGKSFQDCREFCLMKGMNLKPAGTLAQQGIQIKAHKMPFMGLYLCLFINGRIT